VRENNQYVVVSGLDLRQSGRVTGLEYSLIKSKARDGKA